MAISEDKLEQALLQLVDLMSLCRDPWCIFGGTAMFLHGYKSAPIADVDVLVSMEDGQRLIASQGLENVADGGTSRFRSSILLHPHLGDVPVEILAGFEIFADGAWQEIQLAKRVEARLGTATIFIAGIDDIARIFQLSGRPKDLARLKLLEERTRD